MTNAGAVLLQQHWECPDRHCTSWATTVDGKVPMHRCPQLRGLLTPLVAAGSRAKQEPVERGDWVGDEAVQLDGDGRPVMSVVTTRDDGQDATVYAPLAVGSVREP